MNGFKGGCGTLGIIKKEYLVDDESGVVINTKDFKINIFDPHKGYLYKSKAKSVRVFPDSRLSEVLDNKVEIANVYILSESIYKDTNMICVYRNKQYYPASEEDMAKMLGLSMRWFRPFLKKIIDKGIIAKVTSTTEGERVTFYCFSPMYFMGGKYLSASLYMLFKKQLDRVLPVWVIEKFNQCGGEVGGYGKEG